MGESQEVPFVAACINGQAVVKDPEAFAALVAAAHKLPSVIGNAVAAKRRGRPRKAAPSPPPERDLSPELYRYYLAYCRWGTAAFNGLDLEDLEDVACIGRTPATSFGEWRRKKGLDNAEQTG